MNNFLTKKGVSDMIKDDYSLKVDDEDLDGRHQVWIHTEGQTLFVDFGDKTINIMAWSDRRVSKKVFKLNKKEMGDD